MRLKENSTSQKLRGAYYTPSQLANAMVDLFSYTDVQTILEPSCGDGVFIDSLLSKGVQVESITAIEIESGEAGKVASRYMDNDSVAVINGDFFEFYDEYHNQRYFDFILGNPPYIRYQYLTEKQREIQSQILVSHGMKANKLITASR
jgi:adenine-specific DNA-methyltransferase